MGACEKRDPSDPTEAAQYPRTRKISFLVGLVTPYSQSHTYLVIDDLAPLDDDLAPLDH
jgi:hypothetical protein